MLSISKDSVSIQVVAIKIIRKNMQEVDRAIEQYSKNKLVKYLGQVKNGKWVDGDNKGKST